MKHAARSVVLSLSLGMSGCGGATGDGNNRHEDQDTSAQAGNDAAADTTAGSTNSSGSKPAAEADAGATDNGAARDDAVVTGSAVVTQLDASAAGSNAPNPIDAGTIETNEAPMDAGNVGTADVGSLHGPLQHVDGAQPLVDTSGSLDPDDTTAAYREVFSLPTGTAIVIVRTTGSANVTISSVSEPPVILGTGIVGEETVTLSLPAGEYQVEITPSDEAVDYRLIVNIVPYLPAEASPEPGGDKTTALALSVGTEPITVGGYVGTIFDDDDYYRIELPEAATITLTSQNVVGRVYACLYQDAEVIDEDNPFAPFLSLDSLDDQPQTLTARVPRGTYYLRAFPRSSDYAMNLYSLTLSVAEYETLEGDPEPGSSESMAQDLGALDSDPLTIGGYVGVAPEDQDYYRFELTEAATLAFTGSAEGSVLGEVYRDDDLIGEASPRGILDASAGELRLPRGVYFVRVRPSNDQYWENLYSFTLSATAYETGESEPEPGNAEATAQDLGTLGGPVTIGGFVGASFDDADYYRFELTAAASVSFEPRQIEGEITGALYADADVIDESSPLLSFESTNLNDQIPTLDLNAGVYFLRITPSGVGIAGNFYTIAVALSE
jgi:hypothetical protein